MRRSVLAPLLLVVFLGPSTAQADRTFNWAIVDTLSIETNPTYVQSCLDLTPAGEPVRAHLLRNKLLTNAHYLGDYRLAHYDQAGTA
jgi:hypothetical protein